MALHPWTIVSPASRGIGLAVVRHLLKTTSGPVLATARTNLDETRSRILDGIDISDPDRLKVLELDVTKEETVEAAANLCKSEYSNPRDKASHAHLRFAMFLPGILHPERSPTQVSYDDALRTMQINVLGPLMLAKHFSQFLPREKVNQSPGLPDQGVMALMSARVGSISENRLGGWYSYRASKAAVNSIVKTVDIHFEQNLKGKSMCVGLHPGTVKTGLSEEFWRSVPKEKLFSAEFAAEKLCSVVGGLAPAQRGKCWDWQGKEIPP